MYYRNETSSLYFLKNRMIIMKTILEKTTIMSEIETLIKAWREYTHNFGNESAYTDSIIELIQKKAAGLQE